MLQTDPGGTRGNPEARRDRINNGIVGRAMEKLNLIGATLEEIETALAGLGEPRYRARQVCAGIAGISTATGAVHGPWQAAAIKTGEQFLFRGFPPGRYCLKGWNRRYLFESAQTGRSSRFSFLRSGETLFAYPRRWAVLLDACSALQADYPCSETCFRAK